ncbi:hypothetical protein BaRGS_00011923 [Batillaria attramentaria]|uniref:peptidylamidoglycolate lyase n=1 Tax=Batillaria attramentaria TaxID=370345 RepID=A0ABD0LBZ9_9CAEN
MAACMNWLVLSVMVAIAGRVLSMPRGQVPDVPMAEFLTDYLNRQQRLPLSGPMEVPDWPSSDVVLGQVSGVDVTPLNSDVTPSYAVVVFHRGDKPWTEGTFDEHNVMPESERHNITQDTIVVIHPDTGDVMESFGADMFYVPHGVTVDKDWNLWLTDVGTHQVMRIPKKETVPDLILGEKFVPGNDDTHFCKPTDVAVANNGDFFVSDGYCNSRVVKFSKEGKVIGHFGKDTAGEDAAPDSPYMLNVPHSLALVEHLDLLCVADRENQRVLCYNAGLKEPEKFGEFNRTLVPGREVGMPYGIAYNPKEDVMYVAALLSQQPVWSQGFSYSPARAFTYDMEGSYLGGWGYILPNEAEQGPSIPHDIAASPTGLDVYMADVLQQAVHKFTQAPADRKYYG